MQKGTLESSVIKNYTNRVFNKNRTTLLTVFPSLLLSYTILLFQFMIIIPIFIALHAAIKKKSINKKIVFPFKTYTNTHTHYSGKKKLFKRNIEQSHTKKK